MKKTEAYGWVIIVPLISSMLSLTSNRSAAIDAGQIANAITVAVGNFTGVLPGQVGMPDSMQVPGNVMFVANRTHGRLWNLARLACRAKIYGPVKNFTTNLLDPGKPVGTGIHYDFPKVHIYYTDKDHYLFILDSDCSKQGPHEKAHFIIQLNDGKGGGDMYATTPQGGMMRAVHVTPDPETKGQHIVQDITDDAKAKSQFDNVVDTFWMKLVH